MTDAQFLTHVAERLSPLGAPPEVIARLRELAQRLKTKKELHADTEAKAKEIARLRFMGKTYKEIARQLNMTPSGAYYLLHPERRSYASDDPRSGRNGDARKKA